MTTLFEEIYNTYADYHDIFERYHKFSLKNFSLI